MVSSAMDRQSSSADTSFPDLDKSVDFSQHPLKYLHQCVDDNIRVIRYSSYGVAAIGLIIIGRNIRFMKKFRSVEEIPKHFIEKHATMQGRVCEVSSKGVLLVDHAPIFQLKFLQKQQPPSDSSLLPIELASVDLHESGLNWLQKNVTSRHIQYKMLAINGNKCIECQVSMAKTFFTSTNINRELILSGMASLQPLTPEGLPHDHAAYLKLRKSLLKAQLKAQKKRQGIWEQPSVVDRLKAMPSGAKRQAKTWVSSGVNAIRGAWTALSGRFKRS